MPRIVLPILLACLTPLAIGCDSTTIDSPEILSYNPINGATDVPVSTTIEVEFSEPVSPIDVGDNVVTLTGPEGAVPLDVLQEGATWAFQPQEELSESARYVIGLNEYVTNDDGVYIVGRFESDFNTEAVPPVLVSVTPRDGEGAFAVSGTLSFRFSEPVDVDSAYTAVHLTEVNGEVAYTLESDGSRLVLQPSEQLLEATEYHIRVTTEVHDLAGVHLMEEYNADFITADGTPPQLVQTSPRAGATGVKTRDAVVLTFSEDIDPDSVKKATVWVQPLKVVDGYTYGAGSGLDVSFSVDGPRVTVKPNRQRWQEYLTDHVVVIDGITDHAGNRAERSEFRFQTVMLDGNSLYRLDNVGFPGVMDSFRDKGQIVLNDPDSKTKGSYWYAHKFDGTWSTLRNTQDGDGLYLEGGGNRGRAHMQDSGNYSGQHWIITSVANGKHCRGCSPEVYYLTNSHMGTAHRLGAVDRVSGRYVMGLHEQSTSYFRWQFIWAGDK